MHRFFISKDNLNQDKVEISGQDYKHISRSLRLQEGDKIIACTGDGNDLLVKLDEFTDDAVRGKVLKKTKSSTEPDLKVTLAQAIPKNRNMELVAQKTTEIGINEIIPLSTKRTIVRLKGKKRKKRIDRWQRIAEEAAKQSQRGVIPGINDIFTVKQLKTIRDRYDLILVLWVDNDARSLSEVLSDINRSEIKNVMLIIGPEGGFTDQEINIIKDDLNGHSVRLGPRIFRTETAGLVGLSALLYEFNELGG